MIRRVACAELQQKSFPRDQFLVFHILTMNLFDYSCETYFISQDLGMVNEKATALPTNFFAIPTCQG